MRKTGAVGIETHNSVTSWRKITSIDKLNLNVYQDCKAEWCGVLPCPTNWWASCLSPCAIDKMCENEVATICLNVCVSPSVGGQWLVEFKNKWPIRRWVQSVSRTTRPSMYSRGFSIDCFLTFLFLHIYSCSSSDRAAQRPPKLTCSPSGRRFGEMMIAGYGVCVGLIRQTACWHALIMLTDTF